MINNVANMEVENNETSLSSTIERLIDYLNGAECLISTNKGLCWESIKALRTAASDIGLAHHQLTSVCKLATSKKFGDVATGHLIRSLIPRDSVPEDVVILILSKICEDLQSVKIKNLLLRWLVLVFDVISTKTRFHSLYGILFRYIESDALCPTICHLLFLLTTKQDVTHYRIAKLLELQRRVGSQPHICGLLSVYRMYHPSLISMCGDYKIFFKKVDRAWEQSIQRVQQRYGLNMLGESITMPASHPTKKSKKQAPLISKPALNMVHDMEAQNHQPLTQLLSGKIPVHQIKSFSELLEHFSQLDLSSQAFTLLSSTTLQHIISITSDRTIAVRLSFWLHHCLHKELVNVSGETDRGRDLLNVVVQFSELVQECLPVCEAFLFRYLFTWNGHDYRPHILKLITRLRIISFACLHDLILAPLYKLYVVSTRVYFKCSIIVAMTELLSNYLTLEAPRQEAMLKTQGSRGSGQLEQLRFSVYPQNANDVDTNSTISQLVRFVDQMFVEGIETEKNGLILLHYILHFHKQVSSIYKIHGIPIVILPSHTVIIEAIFSLSAPCISTFFQILVNHRSSMATLQREGRLGLSHQSEVDTLNQYSVDVYDTIWRRRAFSPLCSPDTIFYENVDLSALEPLLSNPDDLIPCRTFCVDRHPALVSYTNLYLQVLRKQPDEAFDAEFVMEESFMEFLESRGLHHIAQFIKSTE